MHLPKEADLVLIQRLTHPVLKHFVQTIKDSLPNAKIVYEQDDNLFDLHRENPAYWYFSQKEVQETIKELYSKSDALIVTTRFLKEQLEQYTDRPIYVVENLVNTARFKPVRRDPNSPLTITWGGGDCVDDKTQILTKDGYKDFEDLTYDDLIATLNPTTDHLEYQKPTRIIKEQYNGPMHLYETGNVSYCVTPNHKMYAATDKITANYSLIKKSDINTNFFAKEDAEWEGKEVEKFTIPNTNIEIGMDDWLSFFGYWIADGWTCKIHKCNQVGIAANGNKINKANEIKNTLEKYGLIGFPTKKNDQIRFFKKELWEYLLQFGYSHEKYIPEELLFLSKRQLKILFDSYIAGDGCKEKTSNRLRAYTTSKRLADNLCEIALKLGMGFAVKNTGKPIVKKNGRVYEGVNDSYTVSFHINDLSSHNNYARPKININKETIINYDGMIYCVEVPNHIWNMRRNGKSMWTGNSHSPDIKIIHNTYKYLENRYQDIKFKFIGFLPPFMELAPHRYERVDWGTIDSYAEAIADSDICLAPLAHNIFNDAKSNIKLTEAAACGIPAIGSKEPPYADLPIDIFPMCRKEKDWTKWLTRFIESESLRKEYGQKQREYVLNNYNLWYNITNRINTYAEILGEEPPDVSTLDLSIPQTTPDPPEEFFEIPQAAPSQKEMLQQDFNIYLQNKFGKKL